MADSYTHCDTRRTIACKNETIADPLWEVQWLAVHSAIVKMSWIWRWAPQLRQKSKLQFSGPSKFWKLAMEFCVEAAVLVAVFPVLDTLIQRGSLKNVGWRMMCGSEGLAVALFLIAVIMSKAIKGEE